MYQLFIDLLTTVRRELVLAVDLGLSAILRIAASPDINVVFAIIKIVDALSTGVFETKNFLRVRIPHDLALLEFSRSSSHCARIALRALATSHEAPTAVVRYSWARRVVIGI